MWVQEWNLLLGLQENLRQKGRHRQHWNKVGSTFQSSDKEKESYEMLNKNINFEIIKMKIESNKLNLFSPPSQLLWFKRFEIMNLQY